MEKRKNRLAENGIVRWLSRYLQSARRQPASPVILHAPQSVPVNDLEIRLRENERIWNGFREIELGILSANTLHGVMDVLSRKLPEFFPGVHAVSVVWFDPNYELAHLLAQETEKDTNCSLIALHELTPGMVPENGPRLGIADRLTQQLFFPHASQIMKSTAVAPLIVHGERMGSLNQGSADPHHFTPDTATDLLEHLAAITAICIDNAMNRAQLRRDGLTDMLTQVANRRFFDRRLREEVSQWLRKGGELSCLLVDLDCFKQINDRHGHLSGDLVLKEVAHTLNKGLRDSDVLARYGGEEFVLLLPDTSSERAAEIAERLRRAIADILLKPIPTVNLRVSASFGLATLTGRQRTTQEGPSGWLLQAADQALYAAKARGRNCVAVAECDGMESAAR